MRKQVVKDIEKEFLEPSFRYLVKNGLENTSVRDLCKAMDISYGSLYYWFEGKDDIYISVVKYGVGKVADNLFKFCFEKISTPKIFFDSFLDEIDKYLLELRLVIQVTTSPVYGDKIRQKSMDFNSTYEEYINELGKILDCDPQILIPIVYFLISILVDYVVWEDRSVSEMQLDDLYKTMLAKIEAAKN